jgi:acetyl-CoA carboxylase biotin carboxyl carrier protein
VSLTHAQVRRILELVDSMSAASLEVEVEGFRLRVERSPDAPPPPPREGDPAPAASDEAAPLTADDVEDVLALIESAGFDVVELETPDFKTAVRREATARAAAAPPGAGATPAEASAPAAPAPPAAAPETPAAEAAPASGNGHSPPPEGMVDITAPLVGTFYRSRSPGAPPFVDVGSAVGEETEVCIIEAMKLMNYIPAGVRGTVTEVLAENEQAVEAGTPLFRVDPDGA